MRIRAVYILTILLGISFIGYSQEEKWEKPAGSIENAQVVIEKDKVINLRPVSRRFKSIQIVLPQPQKLSFNYELTQTIDTLSALQVIVRPKTMKDQPLEKLYGLSAKVGYGNFRSPFILINAGNKRSDEFMYNAQLNHFSSNKGAVNDNQYASTRLGLEGKFFLNNVSVFSGLNYHNQRYNIYGYSPPEYASIVDLEYLKQRLNILKFNIGIEDNDLNNNNDHYVNFSLGLLKNNHFDQEFLLNFNYTLAWRMTESLSFHLPLQYSLITQNGVSNSKVNRHLADLRPSFNYAWNSFKFTVGANGFFQQDPADQLDSKIFIYPNLGIHYALNSNHAIGLVLNGEVEQVTQQSMYGDNLFLDSLQAANNNIKDFAAGLSFDGKLTETFGYSLGYNYAHYKRMMFFDNNIADTARFLVVLDNSGVTRHRFLAAATFIKNENLKFDLGAKYNVYSTSDLEEAWHKPQFELNFGSQLTLIDKLHISLAYNILTGIKARDSLGLTKTLSAVNDLNLSFHLDVTDRAGLFIDFRNVLGQNYQVYNNYPVNGFQILGGFSIRF